MWGEKGFSLLKDLSRFENSLPPYDDDTLRIVIEEMREMTQFIEEAMTSTFHPVTNNFMIGVKARQVALERNKRCLLAYQWNRIQRLRKMRWDFGSILPPDIKSNLSDTEVAWFNKYSKSLATYMKSIGGQNGLNITQDMKPPKDLYIEVRCLIDYGKLELEDGEVIVLYKNSRHLMPRSHCEHLIRQGILEHVD